MGFAEDIRKEIGNFFREEGKFRNKLTFFSKEYRETLYLIEKDLQALKRLQKQPGRKEERFLTFDVDGEQFKLSADSIEVRPKEWGDYILATCLSNSALNREFVLGSSKVCLVTDEWHKKIIEHLKEKG